MCLLYVTYKRKSRIPRAGEDAARCLSDVRLVLDPLGVAIPFLQIPLNVRSQKDSPTIGSPQRGELAFAFELAHPRARAADARGDARRPEQFDVLKILRCHFLFCKTETSSMLIADLESVVHIEISASISGVDASDRPV